MTLSYMKLNSMNELSQELSNLKLRKINRITSGSHRVLKAHKKLIQIDIFKVNFPFNCLQNLGKCQIVLQNKTLNRMT